MTRERVLVTGATGFIGRALTPALRARGFEVRGTARREPRPDDPGGVEWRRLDLPADPAQLDAVAHEVDLVVHLAAHVHVTARSEATDARFHAVNVEGTLGLLRAAAAAGARRFVFISTIGVHGNQSPVRDGRVHRFCEDDPPAPANGYSRSKLRAEEALRALAAQTSTELLVLRLPLVFGPGVGSTFGRLLDAAWRGIPIPIPARDSARSMVYVENLCDLLVRCLEARELAHHLYLVADGDVRLRELPQTLARRMGRRARTFTCPGWLARIALRLPVVARPLRSLTCPLLIDARRLRQDLDRPLAVSLDEGLGRTAEWYARQHGRASAAR